MEIIIGYGGLILAAMLGGALNAVAGGGSLISFPSLVAFGVPALNANATNTAALWPGSVSGTLGYREDLKGQGRLLLVLLIPSLVGGLLGAVILVYTPKELFDHIVPFLVLFATVMFAIQERVKRFVNGAATGDREEGQLGRVVGFVFNLFIATYGGYFGAAMSIMLMASLSIIGLRDIHRINALKTTLAIAINGIALVFFSINSIIRWDLALMMAIGSIVGGYGAARLIKRVPQERIRQFVILVGVVVSAWLFARAYL